MAEKEDTDAELAAKSLEAEAAEHSSNCPVAKALRHAAANVRASAQGAPWQGSYGQSGPAQVATPAYRSNYETIFGKKMQAGLA